MSVGTAKKQTFIWHRKRKPLQTLLDFTVLWFEKPRVWDKIICFQALLAENSAMSSKKQKHLSQMWNRLTRHLSRNPRTLLPSPEQCKLNYILQYTARFTLIARPIGCNRKSQKIDLSSNVSTIITYTVCVFFYIHCQLWSENETVIHACAIITWEALQYSSSLKAKEAGAKNQTFVDYFWLKKKKKDFFFLPCQDPRFPFPGY